MSEDRVSQREGKSRRGGNLRDSIDLSNLIKPETKEKKIESDLKDEVPGEPENPKNYIDNSNEIEDDDEAESPANNQRSVDFQGEIK